MWRAYLSGVRPSTPKKWILSRPGVALPTKFTGSRAGVPSARRRRELLVAVGVFVLSQMTIVIQIAFCKMHAEPLMALNIVRREISLLAAGGGCGLPTTSFPLLVSW